MNVSIDFTKSNGLVPAVVQDYKTGNVYMLGYINEEALQKTLKKGLVYFYSRSRQKLWMKGEKSGNKLMVKEVYSDCDKDTILIKVQLIGKNICHTGNNTCFYTKIEEKI